MSFHSVLDTDGFFMEDKSASVVVLQPVPVPTATEKPASELLNHEDARGLLFPLNAHEAQYIHDALDLFRDNTDFIDSFINNGISEEEAPALPAKKKYRRKSVSYCSSSSHHPQPGALEASVKHFYTKTDESSATYQSSTATSSCLCSVLNCTRLARVNAKCLSHSDCSKYDLTKPRKRRQSLPESFNSIDPGTSLSTNTLLDQKHQASFELMLLDVSASNSSILHTECSRNSLLPCEVKGCGNRAHSRKRCRVHGGVRCRIVECNSQAQKGGYCRRHGGGMRCSVPGCPKAAQKHRLCNQHGGKRICTIFGCTGSDRGGGFCNEHRQHLLCIATGCKRLKKTFDGFCAKHQ